VRGCHEPPARITMPKTHHGEDMNHLVYKIIGAILTFIGLLLIAKSGRFLMGLALMFIGFYLAMKKGIKPL
jgi:hypothetical protein